MITSQISCKMAPNNTRGDSSSENLFAAVNLKGRMTIKIIFQSSLCQQQIDMTWCLQNCYETEAAEISRGIDEMFGKVATISKVN